MSIYKKGFTLAEALLSLTMLGVIAAVTLPIIISNYNDYANIAAQKAVGADLRQAIQTLLVKDGTLTKIQTVGTYNSTNERFVKEKLAEVLKITRTCSPGSTVSSANDAVQKCGIKTGQSYLRFDQVGAPTLQIQGITNGLLLQHVNGNDSDSGTNPAEQMYPFVLANGTTGLLLYNPGCTQRRQDENGNNLPINKDNVCVNIVYDVNGAKGPNQVGRDVGFFTTFYPRNSVFAFPILYEGGTDLSANKNLNAVIQYCENLSNNNNASLPTEEEAFSIIVNRRLLYDLNATGAYIGDSDTTLLNLKSADNATGKFICVHKQ